MDKSLAGLLGAMAGMAAVAPSQAATALPPMADSALHARSYADLLKPIPNAVELLKAVEAQAPLAEGQGAVQEVQYHHHHHHRYRRRFVRRHHHHHHFFNR